MTKIIIFGLNNISIGVKNSFDNVLIFTDSIQFKKYSSNNKTKLSDIYILKDQYEFLTDHYASIGENDLFISIGSPWIFKLNFIKKIKHEIYNLHGTHLPMYKGGTVASWYIMNRKRTGLCALQVLSEKIDSGDIIYWDEYLIPIECRKPVDFINLYEEKNIAFIIGLIKNYKVQNTFDYNTTSKQLDYLSTYWPRLSSKFHGVIDWSWNGFDIESFICAFDEPYLGSRTRLNNQIVYIKDVYFQPGENTYHPFQSGLIYRISKIGVFVAVKGGSLLIRKILDKENNLINSKVKLGDRLSSNLTDLQKNSIKVIKTKNGLSKK